MPNALDLFRRALSICLANPLPMWTLGAFAIIPQGLANVGNPPLVAQLASIALTEIVFAATVGASAKAVSGETPDAFESLRIVRDRIGALLELIARQFGAMLLLAITIVGIPFAIRILVRWFFGTQGVVLRGLDAKGAISLSCRLASGRWWQLGLLVLTIPLFLAAPSILALVFLGRVGSLAVSIPLTFALAPPLGCFWTLLFLDLEERTGASQIAALSVSETPRPFT